MRSRQIAIMWIVAAVLFAALAYHAHEARLRLGNPVILTGYLLFAVMVGLGLFDLRKKLPMLPLGHATTWLELHAVGGVFAVALFWLHSGALWPNGPYEQLLAVLFYLVSFTGIAGYIIQRIYPRRLTQTGIEVIYERIPGELADLREAGQNIVLACTDETGNDTLARHYTETLEWFFRRPRFFLNHALGGRGSEHWVRHNFTSVERFLNEAEHRHWEKLRALAEAKNKIDFHYAAQSLTKWWPLLHVPLAAAVLALALWHLILVNVYAL